MQLKNYLLIAIAVICCLSSRAQTWSRNVSYKNSGSVFAYSDIHGGLALMQQTDTGTVSYLMRVDNKGDSLWAKRINDSLNVYSIAELVNGSYVIGMYSGDVGIPMTYVIDHLDSNGHLLNEKLISAPFTNGAASAIQDQNIPKVIADRHNNYYLLYYQDTVFNYQYFDPISHIYVLADSEINRTYIEKYNVNDVLTWRRKATVVATKAVSVPPWNLSRPEAGSAVLTENDGLLYIKTIAPPDQDTIRDLWIEKIDSNGNILWSKNTANYIQRSDSTLYYKAFLDQSTDSTYTIFYKFYDQMNSVAYFFDESKQEIAKISSNGTLITNITVDTIGTLGYWPNYITNVGIQTSNGNYMFPAWIGNDSSGFVADGIATYDKNLHLINFTPNAVPLYTSYMQDYTYTVGMVPNKLGGAFCTFTPNAGFSPTYSTLCNFDSSFNLNPANVSGKVIQDNNSNCITDAGDYKTPGSVVSFTDQHSATWYGITDTGGNYKVNLPDNNYSAIHSMYGYKQNICPSSGALTYSLTGNAVVTNATFYDKLTPNVKDLSTSIYASHFVPGFNGSVYVRVANKGTVTESATLTVNLDANTGYVSSVPSPISISGNTLTYNIANLGIDSVAHVRITTSTPASVSLGTPVQLTASAPLLADTTPANNADTLIDVVVGSFDPNDKSVNRPYHTIAGKEMVYTVNFQNTGTLQAKNVVVVDTISPYLDMSTFYLISGSPILPQVSCKDGRSLIFNFNNINLPDSKANEPASHGTFTYSISSKSNLPVGDTINNTAYIFFDFNSAVVTNTATNVISKKTGVSVAQVVEQKEIALYPNPTNGVVNILVPPTPNNWTISVTDIAGREVYRRTESGNTNLIKCNINAVTGMYFVRIINSANMETTVKKMIIRN